MYYMYRLSYISFGDLLKHGQTFQILWHVSQYHYNFTSSLRDLFSTQNSGVPLAKRSTVAKNMCKIRIYDACGCLLDFDSRLVYISLFSFLGRRLVLLCGFLAEYLYSIFRIYITCTTPYGRCSDQISS